MEKRLEPFPCFMGIMTHTMVLYRGHCRCIYCRSIDYKNLLLVFLLQERSVCVREREREIGRCEKRSVCLNHSLDQDEITQREGILFCVFVVRVAQNPSKHEKARLY